MDASTLRELMVLAYNEGLEGTEPHVFSLAMQAVMLGSTVGLPRRITDDDSLIDLTTKAISALKMK